MIGVLLTNIGTPDEPSTGATRRYLREFLSDPRVIDLAPVRRWFVVNCIIAPFRAAQSAAAYRKIWMEAGSPLLVHGMELARRVQEALGGGYCVELGMRYGRPSIAQALDALIRRGATSIRVLPLFPQYSAAATGSSVAAVFKLAHALWDPPALSILPPFYKHSGFIESFVELGGPIVEGTQADHVLFSFHGLPERQIKKSDRNGDYCLKRSDCCRNESLENHYCYRHQCFVTADLIAKGLRLPTDRYTVCFQSRLGRTPWIEPHTDKVLLDLVQAGHKKVTVFCPSFVADCLETLEENGIRHRAAFLEAGGERLDLVPCPNAHPRWVQAVAELITS